MVAVSPLMLVMPGPCVIRTALSLASSICLCANAIVAINISDSPASVSKRFILFASYTLKNKRKIKMDDCANNDVAPILTNSARQHGPPGSTIAHFKLT
jgi:hypothetical protein